MSRAGCRGRRQLAGALFVLALSLGACASGGTASRKPVSFDPRAYYARTAIEVLHGTASYYADSLAGHSTASGEPYDPRRFTAAHRHLPFGTILRVTRVKTGQWVLVRVNDRGPFAGRSRILDLSKAAARELSILQTGVAEVQVEVLELGHKPARRR